MSIWDSEVVKADGTLFVYVRVQNDYTGNISGSFRRLYTDKNGWYAKVDGSNHYFTDKVEAFIKKEADDKLLKEKVQRLKYLGGFTL